jgi:hypothetical protein
LKSSISVCTRSPMGSACTLVSSRPTIWLARSAKVLWIEECELGEEQQEVAEPALCKL